jgi:hypothetical protein
MSSVGILPLTWPLSWLKVMKFCSFLYQHHTKFHLVNILHIFIGDLILWTAIGDIHDPEPMYLCSKTFIQLCSILYMLRQA